MTIIYTFELKVGMRLRIKRMIVSFYPFFLLFDEQQGQMMHHALLMYIWCETRNASYVYVRYLAKARKLQSDAGIKNRSDVSYKSSNQILMHQITVRHVLFIKALLFVIFL